MVTYEEESARAPEWASRLIEAAVERESSPTPRPHRRGVLSAARGGKGEAMHGRLTVFDLAAKYHIDVPPEQLENMSLVMFMALREAARRSSAQVAVEPRHPRVVAAIASRTP